MSEREQKIRRKAHELWEKAGKPDGQHDHHWSEAERLVDEDEQGGGAAVETGPAQPSKVEQPEKAKGPEKAAKRTPRKR